MAERAALETIFAPATAPGEGAVAIIRISGPEALAVIGLLFRKRSGKPRQSWRSHRVVHGRLLDPAEDRKIDEVLVLYMERDRSFTGDDLVEIHCHGGAAVVRSVCKLLLEQGLRPASPGEFTRRAFLNGRISLDEAEAIDDLVRARSEEAALVTVENLTGALRRRIVELRQGIIGLLALLEANVDFPEDDVDPAHQKRVLTEVHALSEAIGQLARSYERGRLLRHGLRVVLAGRPNVGKSSLMNAILQVERSIVTEVAGTTRDTIEESITFRGLSYVIVDTAGLRETADTVERIGVERTLREVERADLTLLLVDASSPHIDLERIPEPCLIVANKTDLAEPDWRGKLNAGSRDVIGISALTGAGVEELLEAVHQLAATRLIPAVSGPVISSERHRDCLLRALEALSSFRDGVAGEMPLDVCLVDLYEAANNLGLITGEIVTEDILESIFSRFCIGK